MKAYFRGWMGAFGALALTMLAAPKARCADAPLNFIIIMCDSLRFDTLECYSSQYPRLRAAKGEAQMPHIDNFARRATITSRPSASRLTSSKESGFPSIAVDA